MLFLAALHVLPQSNASLIKGSQQLLSKLKSNVYALVHKCPEGTGEGILTHAGVAWSLLRKMGTHKYFPVVILSVCLRDQGQERLGLCVCVPKYVSAHTCMQ